MKAKRNNIQPNWKLYGAIVAVLTVIQLIASIASGVVSFPTETHRSTARQLGEYGNRAIYEGTNGVKLLESKEYKQLEESSESIYTNRTLLVTTIAQFILYVVLTVGLYRYVRKNRLTSHSVRLTVILYMISSVLVTIPTWFFMNWITGTAINDTLVLMFLVGTPFVIAGSILLTFIIARLAEHHYNRSHGFAAD